MKKAHLCILRGACTNIIDNNATIQMKDFDGKWHDVTTISELAVTIAQDGEIRVKPEPVFKEIAYFKGKSGSIVAFDTDYKFNNPDHWRRVSDWTKIEIKDDIS